MDLQTNEKGIISQEEMFDIIASCDFIWSDNSIRQKALFSILYLTGARIAELCTSYQRVGHYNPLNQKVESWEYVQSRNGILKSDVKIIGNDVYITLPIRKKRKKISDRRDIKNEHTLVISKKSPYMTFFLDYLETIENDDDPIFDFTTRTAGSWIKMIDNYLNKKGFYCHLFRKTRLTHISKISETEEDIRQWAGHSDTRSLKPYIALRPIKKFKDVIE